MKQNEKPIFLCLQRISNILLINGGFLDNPGLYSGDMGLVLFFFHYARFTQNELYSEFSFQLIEKLQKRIHQDTPIEYKNGLTGIGSSIEYLVQAGYIEANTDEILEDFDDRIFSVQNFPQLSIETIISIGYYANLRMSRSSVKKEMIQHTILPQIERYLHEHSITPIWRKFCVNNHQNGLKRKIKCRFLKLITNNNSIDVNNLDLGLANGLAGLGMALLSEIDGDFSWISLFPNDFNPIQNESLPL